MEYVKLSVSQQAARQLRRVALEMGELKHARVTHGQALEQLTSDWLAGLYRSRDAGQAAAEAGVADDTAEPCRQTDACCCRACMSVPADG